MRVRELPPLRLHIDIQTPAGRRYRWGSDEPRARNVPGGVVFSSSMPGGFAQFDGSLPRKATVDYSDLERLSTLRVIGPGGDIAGEYRLERRPAVSGDRIAINPSAVGWQAHLDDDKSARMIFRDIDLTQWQPASVARRLAQSSRTIQDPQTNPDATSGAPQLSLGWEGAWTTSPLPEADAWYDAGPGISLGSIRYAGKTGSRITTASLAFRAALSTDGAGASMDTGTTHASGTANTAFSGSVTATAARRFAVLIAFWNAATAAGVDGTRFEWFLGPVAVYGDHGLTLQGTEPSAGLLASDIVSYTVGRWAPLLNFTPGQTVLSSGFAIPHLVFRDRTTAGEIVNQASAFDLQDWAVWENKTFWWYERDTLGRRWRARIAPAQLAETGPQVDRLWESILVSYQDVDGTTRVVGPPGSGADVEDASLKDTDPENPANKLGIIRRDLLAMQGVGTSTAAIKVGQRFLVEQKRLDTSGQATLVGHVQDDRGVIHPAWRVRAGDHISFVDAADPSYRRIVQASYDHDSRTTSIDLDSPAEGLQALLDRLNVVLVPLGLG